MVDVTCAILDSFGQQVVYLVNLILLMYVVPYQLCQSVLFFGHTGL